MNNKVRVVGVGMTPFSKLSAGAQYQDIGLQAVRAVLQDAGLEYRDVQQAYVGYLYADSCAGQAIVSHCILRFCKCMPTWSNGPRVEREIGFRFDVKHRRHLGGLL